MFWLRNKKIIFWYTLLTKGMIAHMYVVFPLLNHLIKVILMIIHLIEVILMIKHHIPFEDEIRQTCLTIINLWISGTTEIVF